MEKFSVRNGFKDFANQNDCEKSTRCRICYIFAEEHILENDFDVMKGLFTNTIVEKLMSDFGIVFDSNHNHKDHDRNCQKLRTFICEECQWYEVYDFIELYLQSCNEDENKRVTSKFNSVLENDKTGYHIISNILVPITNDAEINEIETAIKRSPNNVTASLNKALALYSNKTNPDYNNAIKEMITAVEALCVTIVGGKENTLGKAINKFTEHGIVLHENLINAIKNLYKYTCNEDGKRHGGTNFIESDAEDARFMIISCSAIINLLLVKWENSKESLTNE